tara:strand:+ start:4598 stop:5695 length:1098 start_codon:yes stop_codon:yes gene_type:complete
MPQGKGTYGKKVGRPKKRKYKPKFKLAQTGAITGNLIRGFQAKKLEKDFGGQKSAVEKDIAAFDKDRLQLRGSSTLQQMVDQPISQELVEGRQEAQKTTEATALSAAQKGGAKSAQAGLQAILESGQKGDLAQMQSQQQALTAAQTAKAAEEAKQEVQRQTLSAEELKGMQEKRKEASDAELASRLAKQEAFATAGQEFAKQVQSGEKGMITPEKGKPQVSDGEFSHKKNPIDINISMEKGGKSDMIQEGEKVGELTGGEAIFNPEDTQKMQELVDAKDADALLEHMEMLFKRFEKQDLEHMNNEADKQKAEKGSLVGGQKKLDANKDGVISGDDFKILRERNKAMGGTKVTVEGSYRPKFKFNR